MTNQDTRKLGDLGLIDTLALNVVSEVVDEAYVIVNAALESGKLVKQAIVLILGKNTGAPLAYLEMIRNLRNDIKLDETLVENMNFETKLNMDCNINFGATSTPQKYSNKCQINPIDLCPQFESAYIGQGDESVYFVQDDDDVRNCTTTLINHLFDMSEVERVINDAPEYSIQEYPQLDDDPNHMLQQAFTKIANAFINDTLAPISEDYTDVYEPPKVEEIIDEASEYSFLDDACTASIVNKDVPFYIHNDTSSNIKGFESTEVAIEEPKLAVISTVNEVLEPNDVAYENAFLSLNRDYEQASEERYPEIKDPKYMTFQEVELLNSSVMDLTTQTEIEKEKELDSDSIVFATASGSRKSLVRRCRTQGARILACLRGWWRRKAHGRRKECRGTGSVRGICPISPGLRSRTSSLIDERKYGSPATKRNIRKFNTISETVVNSCVWKDYKFES